jgi:hypothetical protein
LAPVSMKYLLVCNRYQTVSVYSNEILIGR